MITSLLLDLDDTLLVNPNEHFLPAYFKLLIARLGPPDSAPVLMQALSAGSRAMLANRSPLVTLRQAFEADFAHALGRSSDGVLELADGFYREDYPRLRELTRALPEAREVVAWALSEGLQVAIATNPLYPLTAITQRLEWAGVGADEFSFAVVPSMESMHFAKPHPEYFAELLALLGKRPDQVLMAGDDWANDIEAAHAAGLNTYWIAEPRARPPRAAPRPAGQGTLGDFLRWARNERCLDFLEPLPRAPAALLAGLAGDLATFHTRAAAVADWRRQPAEGEWSLTEILCHLRDAEAEVNLPRLERIALEEEPFVPIADTDPWARERNYQAQDGRAALADFARTRLAALDFLRGQPAAYWQRRARHSILGRTTPAELVAFTLEHDRIHLDQIRQLQ